MGWQDGAGAGARERPFPDNDTERKSIKWLLERVFMGFLPKKNDLTSLLP
jgi:hypothetical protein